MKGRHPGAMKVKRCLSFVIAARNSLPECVRSAPRKDLLCVFIVAQNLSPMTYSVRSVVESGLTTSRTGLRMGIVIKRYDTLRGIAKPGMAMHCRASQTERPDGTF